jgi:drug/metabolite transporter (DMT)-like permease
MLLSLYFVQVWNLRLSVEYLPCFLICFGLCPAFLRLERRGDFSLNVLSIIAGTLTASFDFLTTETVTILLPLILVIAIRSAERRLGSPRRVMKTLAGCILCWAAAYLGAFTVKWLAVSLVTGENYLLTALSAAEKRIGGTVSGAIPQKTNLFMALGANFSVLFEGSSRIEVGRVLAYLAILAVVILVIVRLYRFRSKTYPGTGFLLLLGSLVFLRYSVLANHSYMHAFFTYRAMCTTILAILCAMVINLRPGKKKGYQKEWN